MTLKGQQKHFNIKFLKGYGFSINVRDSKIILKNNFDPFSEPQKEEWYVNNMPYEKIVLSGKGYISTEALSLLSEHNRNVILLDTYGKPVTYLNPVMESLTATKYRMAQYDTFRDPVKCQYLARQIVKAKIESQIRFLELTQNQDVKEGIEFLKDSLRNIKENPIIHEAKLSKRYFLEYSKLIPEKYGFKSRNQSKLRISKNHATDVINALLNYGYAVLAGEVAKFVNGLGLDPYYGFYHKKDTSFQALVYDLIEPFRWLVEYSVYKLAISQTKGQYIKRKDYTWTRDGNVVMDSELIRRFLEVLERKFQSERLYEFKYGLRKENGMSMCQEMTIVKIVIQNLADFCIHNGKLYENLYLYSAFTIRSLAQ